MFQKFIERPVLTTVISVLIVIIGVLGITTLPISQYPEIAPPTVTVTASYQGASAEVVLNSVVVPLEEQINGVENMTYMTSSASNDGTATITVYFKLGTNPDMAAVNVQNRVARATNLLPAEVTRSGVITQKRQSSNVFIFALYSDNPAYDQTFIQNYANINIIPQIKRVNGVGDATSFASKDYSLRIWLRPDAMASYGLVPADVYAALADQNLESAPGQFGEQGKQAFQYTLKYRGRLKQESEFENIVLKTNPDGSILRLKDVARVEIGAQSYSSITYANGKSGVGFAINQTAGSNAKEVIEGVQKVLDEAEANFPKGIGYITLSNVNDFLDASIEKVISTLIEAFILVFIVVFLFLQDWRSTLIPAISVPVAIIGTFFFLGLFGFTINILTLFALVLAVGIVVDDAIVVVEAVHAKLDEGMTSAKRASVEAMHDISGAIISITLVMSAVFIPVSFISGSAGVFYKQFGLTLAIAIVLSAINALTLSPALCALFLKPHGENAHAKRNLQQRFFDAFNAGFTATTSKYRKISGFFIKRKWLALGVLGLFTGLFLLLMRTAPTAFVPNEDMGSIFSDISLPPGSSQEETEKVTKEVQAAVQNIPEVQNIMRVVGRSIISGSGSNYGMVIVRLKPWAERTGKGQDVESIVKQLFMRTAAIRKARVIFFAPPTIQGFGTTGGFEFQLQDKTGGSIENFSAVSAQFLGELAKRKEIQFARTSFNPNFPQYQIDVNVDKAKQDGFQVSDILSTLQGYYGGVYASNFNKYGKQFRVIYQADAPFRADFNSLNLIQVRNSAGKMAPIAPYIQLNKVYGPQAINRFNLFTSISVNGAPNEGFSSGDAIKAVQEVAETHLPTGFGYEFSGMTREEMSAGSQTIVIFLLSLLFVYFLLAAQYESYMLPFAVLLPLPIGLAGTFIFNYLFDISNSIYVQITLIMLIGLLAKNAVLIIEYAVARRRAGMDIREAALSGAVARFRPILMTSFAFILGLLPLMFASGAGSVSNQAIGTAAIGGMLIGTIFGVIVVPVLFVMFMSLHEKIAGRPLYAPKPE